MTPTTQTPATPRLADLVGVSDMPRTKTATAKLYDLRRQQREIEQTTATAQTAEDPIARAEARLATLKAEPDRLRLLAEIERAERAVSVAQETDAAELRARFTARKRAAITPLVEAMTIAQARMIALQALEIREHEVFGPATNRFAWPSLSKPDAGLDESTLATWIAGLIAEGLLDPPTT